MGRNSEGRAPQEDGKASRPPARPDGKGKERKRKGEERKGKERKRTGEERKRKRKGKALSQ